MQKSASPPAASTRRPDEATSGTGFQPVLFSAIPDSRFMVRSGRSSAPPSSPRSSFFVFRFSPCGRAIPLPPRNTMKHSQRTPATLQDLIFRLQDFWACRGCLIQQPYDVEVGAGTMHPETFLRVLGPEPYRVAYVQPSRRPADGRYGENPNRLYKHQQLQVILKPSPADAQDLYLQSLAAIGIPLREHDVRFEEDNWESPTLGAWGIGWQVLLDGLEITQFTYFQQCGGLDLDPISVELTYGLERIAAFLQGVDNVFDMCWSQDTSYRHVRWVEEQQFSAYSFD